MLTRLLEWLLLLVRRITDPSGQKIPSDKGTNMRFLDFLDYWNVDRFLMSVLKFALIVATVVIPAVVLVGYAYLMFAYRSPVWWIATAIVVIMATIFGGWFYSGMHESDCHRLSIPTCESCNRQREAARVARDEADGVRSILEACVFNSQQDLDELLAIFGEKVEKLCAHQTELLKNQRRTAREQAEVERVYAEINRYKSVYQRLQEHAPRFKLMVADSWSAYFPDRSNVA